MPIHNIYTKEIDLTIGKNVSYFRKIKGVTRQNLCDYIKVTVQQLQKYETGVNRLSMGRLILIARALEEPVESFYKNVEINYPMLKKTEYQKICDELIVTFRKIRDTEQLRIINTLINTLIK
jgi:transcriptional regulator with XRE-family HTH domain